MRCSSARRRAAGPRAGRLLQAPSRGSRARRHRIICCRATTGVVRLLAPLKRFRSDQRPQNGADYETSDCAFACAALFVLGPAALACRSAPNPPRSTRPANPPLTAREQAEREKNDASKARSARRAAREQAAARRGRGAPPRGPRSRSRAGRPLESRQRAANATCAGPCSSSSATTARSPRRPRADRCYLSRYRPGAQVCAGSKPCAPSRAALPRFILDLFARSWTQGVRGHRCQPASGTPAAHDRCTRARRCQAPDPRPEKP